MRFAKYRIVEYNGKYFCQVRRFLVWHGCTRVGKHPFEWSFKDTMFEPDRGHMALEEAAFEMKYWVQIRAIAYKAYKEQQKKKYRAKTVRNWTAAEMKAEITEDEI